MFKNKIELKQKSKDRLRKRIRRKIHGTADRPRVLVRKSNRYVYVLAVDDEKGSILTAGSTLEKDFRDKNKNTKNTEASRKLGETMAARLKKKKITRVVFDRGTSPYHGRVKSLAEAMRKGGLTF